MTQKERVAQALQIIQENPELPIVAMVNEDIVADDCSSYWMGSWGNCEVTKYWIGDQRVHFYDPDDWDEIYEVTDDGAKTGAYDEPAREDTQIIEAYKNLNWKDAIVIYIELPDQI